MKTNCNQRERMQKKLFLIFVDEETQVKTSIWSAIDYSFEVKFNQAALTFPASSL